MKPISAEVDKLIKKYKTNCPFTIAQALGIQIVYENLGKSLGYYNKHFKIKIIHINEGAKENQKKFICGHELGHAILHPNANTPFLKQHTFFSTDRIEIEANRFAVKLLFSEDYFNGQLSIKDAVEEYGVPKQLILSNLEHKIF